VKLRAYDEGEVGPPGFSRQHLETLQLTASVLGRLIEQQLLSLSIGLEDLT